MVDSLEELKPDGTYEVDRKGLQDLHRFVPPQRASGIDSTTHELLIFSLPHAYLPEAWQSRFQFDFFRGYQMAKNKPLDAKIYLSPLRPILARLPAHVDKSFYHAVAMIPKSQWGYFQEYVSSIQFLDTANKWFVALGMMKPFEIIRPDWDPRGRVVSQAPPKVKVNVLAVADPFRVLLLDQRTDPLEVVIVPDQDPQLLAMAKAVLKQDPTSYLSTLLGEVRLPDNYQPVDAEAFRRFVKEIP